MLWNYPAGAFYEARDQHGNVIGTLRSVDYGYQFSSAVAGRRSGRATKSGIPFDAMPKWAQRLVANGGWFGVVSPTADEPTAIKARARLAERWREAFEAEAA